MRLKIDPKRGLKCTLEAVLYGLGFRSPFGQVMAPESGGHVHAKMFPDCFSRFLTRWDGGFKDLSG